MCSVLLGVIASEEINWIEIEREGGRERERGGGGKEGERDKILKINKVCV